MSQAARRMKANLKIEGRPCMWCQQTLALGDPVALCTACGSDQHAACWDGKGGCATSGCVHAPLARLDVPMIEGVIQQIGQVLPQLATQPQPARTAPVRPTPPPGFKECTGCKNLVMVDAQICDFCNVILSPDGVYHGPVVTAPGATSALVFGIIGLFTCGLIFGVLAIAKYREANDTIAFNPRYGGAGLAVAGLVIGILAILKDAIVIMSRLGVFE